MRSNKSSMHFLYFNKNVLNKKILYCRENATTTRDVSEVAKSEDSDSDEQSVKSENDESGNDSQEDGNSEEEQSEGEEEKHPRRVSNDINEGKTVFIKNVPFTVKNEDLKECMEQFGPVYYALVCVDPLTEHSRGTAFVKFRVSIICFSLLV